MRRAGLLIVAALGATLAVPLVLGGNEALWQTLHFPAAGYLAILAVIATSWFARAIKLHLLLHRLNVRPRFARTLAISLATDFAFISTPAGIGGYAASLYYLRRAGASVSSATTITAADQGLDLLFFTVALPIAGLTVIWSDLAPTLAIVGFGSSAIMIALALGVLLARRTLSAWLFDTNPFGERRPRLRRMQETLRAFVISLRNNASVLIAGGPGFIAGVFALTALQWLSRYGVLWLALALLDHPVPFALTLLLQSLVLHAALWTGVPAGGGGAELGLSALLAAWIPATSIATALLLWRMATLYSCLLAGAVAIAILARRPTAQNTNVHNAHGLRATPVKEGVN
ncbi:MAG: lysylphosphatidylglycerol synthase transmembrane domain-containing protein [Rudaea sp.]|nr:lysylphosphatidylglycerol synthase transmembrane domain-containing protein [Rudaea sp.]